MHEDLIAKHEQRVPRYTSYPTAPHFGPAVDAATLRRWLDVVRVATVAFDRYRAPGSALHAAAVWRYPRTSCVLEAGVVSWPSPERSPRGDVP